MWKRKDNNGETRKTEQRPLVSRSLFTHFRTIVSFLIKAWISDFVMMKSVVLVKSLEYMRTFAYKGVSGFSNLFCYWSICASRARCGYWWNDSRDGLALQGNLIIFHCDFESNRAVHWNPLLLRQLCANPVSISISCPLLSHCSSWKHSNN